MKLANGRDTKSIRQWNFNGRYFLKMQVIFESETIIFKLRISEPNCCVNSMWRVKRSNGQWNGWFVEMSRSHPVFHKQSVLMGACGFVISIKPSLPGGAGLWLKNGSLLGMNSFDRLLCPKAEKRLIFRWIGQKSPFVNESQAFRLNPKPVEQVKNAARRFETLKSRRVPHNSR